MSQSLDYLKTNGRTEATNKKNGFGTMKKKNFSRNEKEFYETFFKAHFAKDKEIMIETDASKTGLG